jgi:branched-subunit amino acid aminotransferase/4-amino-4-deoxychorismate lyase
VIRELPKTLVAEEALWPWPVLAGADETFPTNAVIEAIPLVGLGVRPFVTGRAGPVTRSPQAAYRSAVEEETGP